MPRKPATRNTPPLLPTLTDEAAYMMQFFLDDFYQWFSHSYAVQIRRYHEPWYSPRGQPPSKPRQTSIHDIPDSNIDEPF